MKRLSFDTMLIEPKVKLDLLVNKERKTASQVWNGTRIEKSFFLNVRSMMININDTIRQDLENE